MTRGTTVYMNGIATRAFLVRDGDDRYYPGVVTVDFNHQLAHDGEVYEASLVSTSVAQNNSLDMLLVTGNDAAHFQYEATAGGNARVLFYEAPAVSNAGTPIPVYGVNRVRSVPFGMKVYGAPSVTVTSAKVLSDRFSPGGSGGNAVGGSIRRGVEFILNPNTNYVIRVTNISTGAIAMGIAAEFYEPG